MSDFCPKLLRNPFIVYSCKWLDIKRTQIENKRRFLTGFVFLFGHADILGPFGNDDCKFPSTLKTPEQASMDVTGDPMSGRNTPEE